VWLGQSFLQQFFTVWDVPNNQAGFAVSSHFMSMTGPWIAMYMAPGGGMSTLAVVLIVIGSAAVIGIIAVVVVTQMRKKNDDEEENK
jgi:apolipoprotein N-acyltransferase